MKKGQIRQGCVTEVQFPGKGLVRLFPEEEVQGQREQADEYAVVKNVLPGQKVRLMISKVRKGKGEGRLLEVLEPSPDEIPSCCPHFENCGGCIYQGLPYEKQLSLKEKQVKKLLEGVLANQQEPWVFEPIKPSPRPFGYRNKMEFSFGDEYKDGPLALGMHKKGSFYDIVSVRDCQIVEEDYRKILCAALDWFSRRGVRYFHRLTHEGYLRHLLVRRASHTGEILIALVTTTQTENMYAVDGCGESAEQLLAGFRDMLLGLSLDGKITGILHIENDSVADVVRSDRTEILYGQDYFYEELLGLKFRISVFSFFQTNSYGAQVLYQTAREYIGQLNRKDCVVYDLYSGTGTIAQLMAPVAGKVIGVEIVEEAVEAARENARLNGLNNCEFIAGDVLRVLDTIRERPDYIILDPPRDGIHPKALQKIIDYGVERLVYISCKPTSLVRDLEVFLENGYRVVRAAAVDQFPWTGNVETVVLLSQLRQKPDDYIDVDVDVAELEGTSAETKATYEKIKKYVAEHNDGMKVSNLYIAQVKRKCGIELAENFNLPKSEDARQPRCPKEKEEAIVEALKAFQMI